MDTQQLLRENICFQTEGGNHEHLPLISVITPSIRPEGVAFVEASLKEQTFKDFEWILELSKEKEKCDLCHKLNEGLKKSKGKWIVMWQDYIKAPPDGLEKFLKVADEKKFITGALGHTTDWENIKWDWRAFRKWQPIQYYEWEADWAIAPRKAFFELGGYDEEYDNYWSIENVNLAFRAEKLGYTFWVLPDNKAVHFEHDTIQKHPFRHKIDADWHSYKIRKIDMGEEPIRLKYLK